MLGAHEKGWRIAVRQPFLPVNAYRCREGCLLFAKQG